MDGDLEPVDGGLKNDLGSWRMRNGNWSGFLPSGFSTVSNSACKSVSEFWSTRTTRLLLTAGVGLLGPVGSILMLTCWCCSCCCCCKPDMLTSSVRARVVVLDRSAVAAGAHQGVMMFPVHRYNIIPATDEYYIIVAYYNIIGGRNNYDIILRHNDMIIIVIIIIIIITTTTKLQKPTITKKSLLLFYTLRSFITSSHLYGIKVLYHLFYRRLSGRASNGCISTASAMAISEYIRFLL